MDAGRCCRWSDWWMEWLVNFFSPVSLWSMAKKKSNQIYVKLTKTPFRQDDVLPDIVSQMSFWFTTPNWSVWSWRNPENRFWFGPNKTNHRSNWESHQTVSQIQVTQELPGALLANSSSQQTLATTQAWKQKGSWVSEVTNLPLSMKPNVTAP